MQSPMAMRKVLRMFGAGVPLLVPLQAFMCRSRPNSAQRTTPMAITVPITGRRFGL